MEHNGGINFISNTMFSVLSICGNCRCQAMLNYIICFNDGNSFAICPACRDRLIAEAGIRGAGDDVVLFPRGQRPGPQEI